MAPLHYICTEALLRQTDTEREKRVYYDLTSHEDDGKNTIWNRIKGQLREDAKATKAYGQICSPLQEHDKINVFNKHMSIREDESIPLMFCVYIFKHNYFGLLELK